MRMDILLILEYKIKADEINLPSKKTAKNDKSMGILLASKNL